MLCAWVYAAGTVSQSRLEHRFRTLHETLCVKHEAIQRIAFAIYDSAGDTLKTFLLSTKESSPLSFYEAKLSEVPSLLKLAQTGKSRVINDLSDLKESSSEHTQRILRNNLLSSYTVPVYDKKELFGFLFFNSTETNYFSTAVLLKLRIYIELLSLMVLDEVRPAQTLRAAVNMARGFTGHRDAETGAHLDRMARYARLIGKRLAKDYGLSEEYIELLFQLTPLHDLGKISIPDNILLKEGKLTDQEFAVMQTHVHKGSELVDTLLDQFELREVPYARMLRNLVVGHHENFDGSGYPYGLTGASIPLEARITRVADVFDALTSDRPYKKAWSNREAFAELKKNAETLFDPDCVIAICENEAAVIEIQNRFGQDLLG